MIQPRITILIGLYNAARDWHACWDSLRAQTFSDWECIAINDGSTDDTAAVLDHYEYQDNRLRVLTNERNIGLTASLNRGLREAQGQYIARLDADDRALSERLEQQYIFLNLNPSVGVLGGAYDEIRPDERRFVQPPRTHTGIVWQLGFQNALMHPAIMARREMIEAVGGYDESLPYAQDYDLWVRLIGRTQFANLPNSLIEYAVHPQQISQARASAQQQIADAVSQRRLEAILGESLPLEVVQTLRLWYTGLLPSLSRESLATMGLYFRLLDRLAEDASLDRAELGLIRRYWQARIARLAPAWADVRAAGWSWRDQMAVGARLLRQRIKQR
jgi:glycosyltransferase involved in cell wall biosynthesis